MKNKVIFLGCGGTAIVVFLVVIIFWASLSSSFVKFGVVNDLISYRTAVLEMDMDHQTKKSLVADFEEVRRSVMKENNIGFGEWVAIDASVRSIFADGTISQDEYEILKSEIEEMKRLQNIQE